MKAVGQMQAFLGNGDQHVCADRDPDLRLDRVLASSIKRLDSQVLLNSFEKQFDLPALAIQICNQLGFEGEVVGQKRDAPAIVILDDQTLQRGGVVFAGIENCHYPRLISVAGLLKMHFLTLSHQSSCRIFLVDIELLVLKYVLNLFRHNFHKNERLKHAAKCLLRVDELQVS